MQRHALAFDMVHAFQVGYSSATAVVTGNALSKPTLISLSGSGAGGDVKRHRRTPWGRLFLHAAFKADRLVTVNRTMRHELDSAGFPPDRIEEIPNSVDLAHYRPPADREKCRRRLGIDNRRVVLYAGRLAREKGVDFLVRAFARLDLPEPVQLYILGSGPEKKRLKRLVECNGLTGLVTMPGDVDDVIPYLQAADVFVMPSLHEGLSNAVLEAMACGTPVVASRVAGNDELIQNDANGLLIDRDSPDNLAAALSRLLRDRSTMTRLSQAARESVKNNYSLEKIAGRWAALYQALLQGGGSENV